MSTMTVGCAYVLPVKWKPLILRMALEMDCMDALPKGFAVDSETLKSAEYLGDGLYKRHFMLLRDGDELLGYCAGACNTRDQQPADGPTSSLYVQTLLIRKDMQGQGWGRTMIHFLQDCHAEIHLDCYKLSLTQYYKKLGFKSFPMQPEHGLLECLKSMWWLDKSRLPEQDSYYAWILSKYKKK